MSDLLDRFHQILVQEIRQNRPEYLEAPFTVAEIYQNLVPYRTHRDEIGVEMNGDYEDALLRLLSGQGDYLILESDVARREIREELQSANPNTGLFRDFAAADVRLNPKRTPSEAPDDADLGSEVTSPEGSGEPFLEGVGVDEPPTSVGLGYGGRTFEIESDAEEHEERAVMAVGQSRASDDELMVVPLGADLGEAPASDGATEASTDVGVLCHWCREELPRRDLLNFCPFCGSDLRVVPCAGCGEELEAGWRFCPTCGTEAAS